MSKLTQFVHTTQISYIHPNVFNLNSLSLSKDNTVQTINVSLHEEQWLTTHVHAPLAYPMYKKELSAPAEALYKNQNSTVTTDPKCNYHNELQVYSAKHTIIPPSEYHTIPVNSKVTMQIKECLINNEVQLLLTHLYIH
tara:strand:- start:93 stop:509 length:417 start_codon:yes stop_codon:yes gene_type:complete